MAERWYPDTVTTDAERIEFLWEQLAHAVIHLRAKDATEEATIKRMERVYGTQIESLRARIQDLTKGQGAKEKRLPLREAMDRAMRRKPN